MPFKNLSKAELLDKISKINERIISLNDVISFIDDPDTKAKLNDSRSQYIQDLEILKQFIQSK
ncbi:MAG: hypothetical protein K0R26_955 [Bacteroidota bacterium]|jgi:hypothetical protein|nr:hypothetical protein [Bacteroidota bacterium]